MGKAKTNHRASVGWRLVEVEAHHAVAPPRLRLPEVELGPARASLATENVFDDRVAGGVADEVTDAELYQVPSLCILSSEIPRESTD